MRLYPSLPRRRTATIAGDLAVLALVVVFAFLGNLVHDSVAELSTLGRGVADAGGQIQRSGETAAGAVRGGLEGAAGAIERAPVVGGPVADGLRRGAAQATGAVEREAGQAGGSVVAAGRDGEQRALDTARVLGWVTFLVPLLLLLSRWLPPRVRQVQGLSAAARVLAAGDGAGDPDRRRALAERAAFGLPYATLLRHTRDPLGDLLAGRHEPLVAAVAEDAGLAVPGVTPSPSTPPAGRRA